MSEEKAFESMPLAFIGHRVINGELRVGFIPVARLKECDVEREAWLFHSKVKRIVGGIYDIEVSGTTIKDTKNAMPTGQVDTELAAIWTALDRAARYAKQVEREAKTDRLREFLEPLAREYRRLPAPQRVAFELAVIRALQTR